MHSLLPATVAVLVLGYGLFVVAEKGSSRTGKAFLALCATAFFWQITSLFLFQVRDPQAADVLVKVNFLLLLFLPTLLYQFLAEMAECRQEARWISMSYAFAATLGIVSLSSNLMTNGYYEFDWGVYPKAGLLHPAHLLHTALVIARALHITQRQQQITTQYQRVRLGVCLASTFLLALAAIDYLTSYGSALYPLGGVAVAVSFAGFTVALVRRDPMSCVAVAATIAHEMRTPLATIRMQAASLKQALPDIQKLHELAAANGLLDTQKELPDMQRLATFAGGIIHQVDRSNVVIDLMLAAARMERIDSRDFKSQSAQACLNEAIAAYPFQPRERNLVTTYVTSDFQFHGCDSLMVYVLFNLLKNSLYALKAAGKGAINIELTAEKDQCLLKFTDTGAGIPAATLPRIFETFFTTKKSAGAGIGLAFCRQVIESFGGQMRCESVEGQYTTFTLAFRATDPAVLVDTRRARHAPWSGMRAQRIGLR